MNGSKAVVENERILYWDIAKGITILLVVLGHLNSVNPYVKGIIFTYHMPFFFIANAYFIKDYDIRKHAVKSAKSILLPYCIVSLICAVISTLRNTSGTADHLIFWQLIKDMIVGMSRSSTCFRSFGGVWIVWFLPCLYAAKILYVGIMKYMQKFSLVLQLVLFLLLAAAGIVIGVDYAYLPWSFDIALVALPFMWVGDYLYKRNVLEKYKWKLAIISFVIWVGFGSQQMFIEMAVRHYPGFYLCMLEAVAGSIVVIVFSMVLEKKMPLAAKGFSICGKHSMVILAIHNLEARYFDWDKYIFSRIPLTLNWIGMFIIKITLILMVTWVVVEVQRLVSLRCESKMKE